MLDDLGVVGQPGHDGRQHEVALALNRSAAGLDLAAAGLGLGDGIQISINRIAAVERAHQVLRVGRVADLAFHLLVGGDQLGQHVVVDRLFHQQAAGGGAALAGGADRAEHDRRNRQFQIGAGVNDDRVVAAQFQQRAAHTARDALADHAADLGGPGEADQRDALVVDELLGDVAAGIVEQEEDVRETGLLQRLIADLHRRDGRQRGLRRRLPDGDVAADRRDERIPRPHRHREIERRDHADDADRVPLLVHAVARTLAVHGQAVQLARQTDRELADINHFLHFAVAFGLGLAHFQRDQRTQRVLVRAQRVCAQADRLAATRRRGGAPDLERRLGAFHDEVVIGLRRGLHPAQHLARGRIDRLDHPGVGGGGPLAMAKIRAGFAGAEAKRGEDGMGHRKLLGLAGPPGKRGAGIVRLGISRVNTDENWWPRHDSNVRPVP